MMKFFKYLFIGLAACMAIGVGMVVLGLALGLAAFAIKIGVIALVGYGVVKLISGLKKKDEPRLSEADRKWLES
jgi:predicted lipid-binding transport protein (Tim44 family)